MDMDIKGFFDNISHDLMMRAVRKHTEDKWVLLYVERWLKAPVQLMNGEVEERTMGTPQGNGIRLRIKPIRLRNRCDSTMLT